MDEKELRERVLNFLYGGMSKDEEEGFRAELEENADLARLLAEEERFHGELSVGSGTEVPEEMLQESRVLLRAALRREGEVVPLVWERMVEAVGRWVPKIGYVGGALAILLCGVLLGRTAFAPGVEMGEIGRVIDLRVRAFDAASGRVRLELNAISSVELEGNLGDREVQELLATALQGDMEPGARLQVAGLLRYQATTAEIRRALIYALLEDENPGVRIEAVEGLKELAGDEQVRQALCQALLGDKNPGVRVAAVEALRDSRDRATLQVLEQKMYVDDNEYIRATARQAFERGRGSEERREL
jgi:hypothetical protein